MSSRLPRKFREIQLTEAVDDVHGNWRELLVSVAFRREGVDVEPDRVLLDRGVPDFHVSFPADTSDADADRMAEEITRECDAVLVRDRRVRALTALANLEAMEERLRDSQGKTRSLLQAMEAAAAKAKTTDEMAEIAKKYGPLLVGAWGWLRAFSG